MTFADLRALHALIGTAIDDIERVYRPHQRPGSRRPSQSSGRPTPGGTPVLPGTSRSSTSTSNTDSDVEDSADADISMPPTPVSPVFSSSSSNNSVRFVHGKGSRKVRDRAQTLSSLPQPPFLTAPGSMPPPILKQPPLDWPSLHTPVLSPNNMSSPSASSQPTSPHVAAPSTPSQSPSVYPLLPDNTSQTESPHTPINYVDARHSKPAAHKAFEPDANGETPRYKEWRQKCEELTTHSEVTNAVNRIVAACSQMTAMVQKPFLTICDASMGYHLPACLRFLEASHTVEILRDAGPFGLHVKDIAERISSGYCFGGEGGVDPSKLSHIMRLLATHHIGREVRPDVFANNRVSSLIDTGKSWRQLVALTPSGKEGPDSKYEGTDGVAAFVGLCTDELFKASAYLADCYLYPLSSPPASPTKSTFHFHVDDLDTVPPVPPLPSSYTSYSASASVSAGNDSTASTSNDSKTSFLSPMSRLRRKKSEIGLTIHIDTPPNLHGPMTFAQNPHQLSPTSLFVKAHAQNHSRTASYASSNSDAPGTPPPAPPPTPARPGILKRLSNRSGTPTPETPKSPINYNGPPIPPNTPRSPVHRSASSMTLSTAYNNFNISTPRSTPNREHDRSRSAVDLSDLLSTPKSNPNSAGGREHLIATPKSTPCRERTVSMHVNGSARKTSPPTPKSPLVTRKQELSAIYPHGNGDVRQNDDGSGPGLLGPAFDLRPPALASSPRAKTFPSSHADSVSSGHDGHGRTFASPLPPPIPPKSSLRNLRSAANASTTSLVSTRDRELDNGFGTKKGHSRKPSLAKASATSGSEMYAPFNLAFNTRMRYFEWLEKSENAFRLKRFGKAMTGTAGWEVPNSIVSGFPWHELPRRSVVIDVGGGIGSTSMLLANAFPHLRFVIQDRAPVVEMGSAAWRARYPDILDSGRAVFQAHDFFRPQPSVPLELNCRVSSPESESTSDGEDFQAIAEVSAVVPAVFLLRVITHDWPDSFVTRILLHLREAAGPHTKLVIADFVLPLACIDEDDLPSPGESGDTRTLETTLDTVRKTYAGTLRSLAPEGSPLLPNLGKANAVGYWLDLTMRSMFNAQERTLRELTDLTLTAGWKITQVTRHEGSLFGHITAVPVDIPPEALLLPPLDDLEEGALDGSQGSSGNRRPINARSPTSLGDTFLTMSDLPSEETIRMSVITGHGKVNGKKEAGKGKRGRERSSTFTGQRNVTGKDGKGGEVRRGLRTIMRMLSKPQLRGGESSPSSAERHS